MDTTTAKPVNGTGATAGKSPRDYMRERITSRPIPARIVATLNPRFFDVEPRRLSQDARRHARLPR